MDLGEKLKKNAEAFPEKPAIVFRGKVTTYGDLNDRAVRFGNAMTSLGIRPRDKVAVILRNSTEYLEILHGLCKAGLVHVPINWRFAPEEMRYVISNSESGVVVVSEEFAEKLGPVKDDLDSTVRGRYILIGRKAPWKMLDYESILDEASNSEPGVKNAPTDPFYIGYTSGTTGFPKGAVSRHGDWPTKATLFPALFRLDEDTVQLLTMPLFHINAIGTSSVAHYAGHTVVVMEHFDPEEALRLIEKYKVTFSSMVPTMYHRLKNLPSDVFDKYDNSSMKSLIQSSAPIPFPTKEWIIRSFKNAGLHEVYGGTETTVVTYLAPEEQLERPGSVGRVLPNVEIKLVDEKGNEVAQGEVGQVVTRLRTGQETAVSEYYKDEKATEASFRDGWFSSGDMARMDEDGFYYLVDRKFDMIISGGENIYPAEIEEVLYKHEDILESAVIGVPDDEWGEQVKAVVVLREGRSATSAEIIAYCKEHLAGYKVPRTVDFATDLPKTDTGKILKKLIKAPYWKDRDVNI
jgi:acyl-CoA synthetase (AMP-forming)/AMP-acid ligase II